MSVTSYNLIVLRYGELFLKGENRPHFESILIRNVKQALANFSLIELERGQGRLFLTCQAEDIERALACVIKVFGLSSASPAIIVPAHIEQMGEVALNLVKQVLTQQSLKTFRVQTRRSDKSFPLPSPEINRQIGAYIFNGTGLGVDLTDPDLTVGVEVGRVKSFIYTDRMPGAGGLPVGISGTVGLLLSGGIDSPVAGYLMQKRGCTLHAIYFHSPPYVGNRTKDKVCQLATKLATAQGPMNLSVVPFTDIQLAIREKAPCEAYVLLYRRMMMRIASQLAHQHGLLALATGENLGQVASQTLENLACIQQAATCTVFRPLLTNDKAETITLARRIGTFDLSVEPYEDCCSLFIPKHPLTRSSIKRLEDIERHLDVASLINEAVSRTELISITS